MGKNPPSSMFYRTRLGAAAAAGMFVVCNCQLCRRQPIYLATDLLEIYHGDTFVRDLFGGRCPRCNSADFWRVQERHATNSEVGMLTVAADRGEDDAAMAGRALLGAAQGRQ